MKAGKRKKIIKAYGKVLGKRKYSVGRESDLPFPKELIREAVLEELLNPRSQSLINALEVGYLELESFVSESEFEIVKRSEEMFAKTMRKIVSESSNSVDEIATDISQISDYHLKILNKINDKQKERSKELESLKQSKNQKQK